jgi:hypothetical protein
MGGSEGGSAEAPIREDPASRASRRETLANWLVRSLPLFQRVFLLWLGTRVAYLALTYMANALHLFQAGPQVPGGMIFSWERWDTNWYLIISRVGYQIKPEGNFFPLYPATIGWVSWLLGDGSGPIYPQPDRLRVLVAIGLSNLGLLAGLYAVARLAELDAEPGDDRAGTRAAWIMLAYPFAMAWTAPLAEGFFLAFTALALLFARKGRWYAAAVPALLAGLTRPVALILVAPLAWEYARQQGWWERLPPRPSLAGIRNVVLGAVVAGAAPAGMCIFFTYLYVRFGDFLLALHTQEKYHVAWPLWRTAGRVMHNLLTIPDTFLLPTESFLIVLFALIIVVSIRRIPFAYMLYMAGLLYLVTAAPVTFVPDVLVGATRYLAGAIPVFLIVARWAGRRPWLETLVISTGMMLQGAITIGIFQYKLSA